MATVADAAADAPDPSSQVRSRRLLLLVSVVLVGACGLMYELALGAVASYLMGDSVTQYSLVIGAFLAAMGLGAWLTQWIKQQLLAAFLLVQLVVGVIGGFSVLFVFVAFAYTDEVTLFVIGSTTAVGVLVGMEIPLILRLLKSAGTLRVNVAHVLSADYIGALAASLAFPFVMLPLMGLVRSALMFGMLNVLIGTFGTVMFWRELPRRTALVVGNVVAWCLLLAGTIGAGQTTSWVEDRLYQDEIIFAETTPYQRIVVTRWRNDYRLHLNGHLQFSSADEYRYHEALVLPAISAALHQLPPRDDIRILILGGGDGLAARQCLATSRVDRIDLVDIDPRVVELFRENRLLQELNDGALRDPRVTAHFEDAMVFLRNCRERYDVVIMDLPDPSSTATNKLYTDVFFGLAVRRLTDHGVLLTQASSPFYARRTFWCIVHTIEAAIEKSPNENRHALPYHVYIPSFGDWGFVMVTPRRSGETPQQLVRQGRFLTRQVFTQAQVFPPDSQQIDTPINRLDTPVLYRYHADDWSRWGE